MLNKNSLKFALSLLDDPDSRSAVLYQLKQYGPSLEKDIIELNIELSNDSYQYIIPLIFSQRENYLVSNWKTWKLLTDDKERLEKGVEFLEEFQHGLGKAKRLKSLLRKLEMEFRKTYPLGNELDLAQFLFREKKIVGAKEDYYNPLNSSLIYAIENKKGLPITLAIIYILLGKRLNFQVEGVNFPGHFLAKTFVQNEPVLVDGFNGGRIFLKSDIQNMADKESVDSILQLVDSTAYSENILKRVLGNLINAFRNKGEDTKAEFFSVLLETT